MFAYKGDDSCKEGHGSNCVPGEVIDAMSRRKKGQDDAMTEVALSEQDIQDIRAAAEIWAEEYGTTGTSLSREALRLIYVMLHPLTGNSPRKWAEIAGVDHKTFYRNRTKPEWKAAVESLREKRSTEILAKADRVIERLLESDDPNIRLKAARTIYERLGEFVHRVETTHVHETLEQRLSRERSKARLYGQQNQTSASAEQLPN